MSTNPSGLLNAFIFSKDAVRSVGWEEIRAWSPEQGILWAHLDFTRQDSVNWINDESGLDELAKESLTADETRPRITDIDGGLLISLRGVNGNPGSDPEDMVAVRIYCDENRIVTTRRRRLFTIRKIADEFDADRGPRTVGAFIALLADGLVEQMSKVIQELEDRLDDLEEQMLEDPSARARGQLLDLRREAIMLRRYLSPQREALNGLKGQEIDWLSKRDRLQLREVNDQITRYVEDLDSVRDRAAVANEELAARLAEQLNARMYLLSIIAGIFLPLGFLTGLFGINVGGMPWVENSGGFLIVSVLLTVITLLRLAYFRFKRWL